MIWFLYVGGGLIALFVVIMVWGILHIRQSRNKALAEVRKIEIRDMDSLVRQCIEVFDTKLGVQLNLDNCGDAAQKLDDAFQNPSGLKAAFQRDDFYWYFVKPVGACLGELLRRHAGHVWLKKLNEAPHMEAKMKEGQTEVYPFDKVITQISSAEPGDLVAYVMFATAGGSAKVQSMTDK
jgi:hypothetical protein